MQFYHFLEQISERREGFKVQREQVEPAMAQLHARSQVKGTEEGAGDTESDIRESG